MLKFREHYTHVLSAALCLSCTFALAQTSSNSSVTPKEAVLTAHARGPFEVKTTPQEDKAAELPFGRMRFDKQFHGDLEGASKGEMLSLGTGAKGSSGAYVALERVTGTLRGRSGSFTLVHTAIMNRGVPQLTITVVPDSGTGELTGIAGKLDIKIEEGGQHFYDFEYTLPK